MKALTTLPDFVVWLRPAGWPALPGAVRGRVRALSWFAIAAQPLFVVGWIVGWALEPGYSPVRMYVSELGRIGAADPWIFDVSTVIWGAGFIALGIAMSVALRTRRWSHVAPGLFVLASIFAILCAPLRLDCAASVNRLCRAREEAGLLSWHYYAHQWAAVGIQVALTLTPFALARSAWPGRLARLMLYGALAIVIVSAAVFVTGVGENWDVGLVQRLQLAVVHGWVLLCAAALIVEASSFTRAPDFRWQEEVLSA
ncbi:MAG: DUF998 domain-containing protein [Solirubrobacteraceae bacterium]